MNVFPGLERVSFMAHTTAAPAGTRASQPQSAAQQVCPPPAAPFNAQPLTVVARSDATAWPLHQLACSAVQPLNKHAAAHPHRESFGAVHGLQGAQLGCWLCSLDCRLHVVAVDERQHPTDGHASRRTSGCCACGWPSSCPWARSSRRGGPSRQDPGHDCRHLIKDKRQHVTSQEEARQEGITEEEGTGCTTGVAAVRGARLVKRWLVCVCAWCGLLSTFRLANMTNCRPARCFHRLLCTPSKQNTGGS